MPTSKRQIEWRKRNPLWSRKARHAVRNEVFNHYCGGSVKCGRCGIDDIDVLTLDHVNGGGREERRKLNIPGGAGLYNYVKKLGFPKLYQVLCFNCNWKKEIERRNKIMEDRLNKSRRKI